MTDLLAAGFLRVEAEAGLRGSTGNRSWRRRQNGRVLLSGREPSKVDQSGVRLVSRKKKNHLPKGGNPTKADTQIAHEILIFPQGNQKGLGIFLRPVIQDAATKVPPTRCAIAGWEFVMPPQMRIKGHFNSCLIRDWCPMISWVTPPKKVSTPQQRHRKGQEPASLTQTPGTL